MGPRKLNDISLYESLGIEFYEHLFTPKIVAQQYSLLV